MVLIAGGANQFIDGKETPVSSTDIFNPKQNKFIPSIDMSIPRFKHSATLLGDGRVLIIGGADSRMMRGKYDSAEFLTLYQVILQEQASLKPPVIKSVIR